MQSKLSEWMHANGVRIFRMASELGISISTLHNFFQGRDITLSTAVMISHYTGGDVSVMDLMSYDHAKHLFNNKKYSNRLVKH